MVVFELKSLGLMGLFTSADIGAEAKMLVRM